MFHSFSNGRHCKFVVIENAKLTIAIRKIWMLSRIRHCFTLPTRRMKKRQIDILANVAPIMNHGWPRKSNSKALAELRMELPSMMLKTVPINATTLQTPRASCQYAANTLAKLPRWTYQGNADGVVVHPDIVADPLAHAEPHDAGRKGEARGAHRDGEKDRPSRKVCRHGRAAAQLKGEEKGTLVACSLF
ncbi:uncharacterized protein E0L32_007375 [Thyridium curvatum]|uniref:Uncharacterized protein n=1 Tax=Thyridium curvatum TaxID=1093900 RepID=A0A507AWM9_9PEZI|nr:uncharacterized protein E0L32_007375 [Thyridium curvatum]TPX11877.1 hypothetical protein E0L32_007375 [Thyridium curvatum]